MENREYFRLISDFFALPGLFCLFGGGLVMLSQKGAFTGLRYLLGRGRRPYAPTKKSRLHPGFLLGLGGSFLTISALFAALFHL